LQRNKQSFLLCREVNFLLLRAGHVPRRHETDRRCHRRRLVDITIALQQF